MPGLKESSPCMRLSEQTTREWHIVSREGEEINLGRGNTDRKNLFGKQINLEFLEQDKKAQW